MSYDLSCLSSCFGESQTEDNIVQTLLQHGHQVIACHARHSVGFFVVVSEGFLQHAIDEFCFLFLSQLQTILGNFTA